MHARTASRKASAGSGLMILLAIVMPIASQRARHPLHRRADPPVPDHLRRRVVALILHAFLTQFPPFQRIAASTLAFIIVFIMLAAALRRAWRSRRRKRS